MYSGSFLCLFNKDTHHPPRYSVNAYFLARYMLIAYLLHSRAYH
jgi:hypothetical protein